MNVQVGDEVLLKTYPRGRKFEPAYDKEVYEVVDIEEKGVTVKDCSNRLFRRHKDDIKRYYRPECFFEEEEDLDEDNRSRLENERILQDEVLQEEPGAAQEDQEEDEPEQPQHEAPPAEEASQRPQRQRHLPERFGDYVMDRIRKLRLGSVVTSEL